MKKYRKLTKKEEEQTLIKIMDTLLDDSVPYSGAHRRRQWEKGWGENLKSGNLKPKYFGKYPVTRLNGQFVKGVDEQKALYTIVDELAEKYLLRTTAICEFGCGTGHNLVRIANKFFITEALPLYRFIGLDWASSSQKILRNIGLEGYKFDFFNPKFKMPNDSSVYTVAALEQTGTNYKKFVSYLLKNKPKVVVHIEPIPELLDPTKLLDYLSIKYMQKRKYLSGYLDYLKELEKKGKIKILEARRSGIGSLYIDGYSVVVWKPI